MASIHHRLKIMKQKIYAKAMRNSSNARKSNKLRIFAPSKTSKCLTNLPLILCLFPTNHKKINYKFIRSFKLLNYDYLLCKYM